MELDTFQQVKISEGFKNFNISWQDGQPWRKSNLICFSFWSLLPTFIHIWESIAKKSPDNEFYVGIYSRSLFLYLNKQQ